MTTTTVAEVLAAAGPGHTPVARPGGPVHMYRGSLTPSGRSVPRGGQAACRARILHRLSVIALGNATDRHLRVCARCSARFIPPSGAGRAAPPVSRDDYLAAYGELTAADLAQVADAATTHEDVDQANHLALLVLGIAACREQLVGGRHDGESLDDVLRAARRRVTAALRDPDEAIANVTARQAHDYNLRAIAKQRSHDRWQDRENRIAQLGFVNATSRRGA